MKVLLTDRLLEKWEPEGAKMRMCGGAWTLNLSKFPVSGYDRIVYHTETGNYSIETDLALTKGFLRAMGGEKKLIVPCKWWTFKSNETLSEGKKCSETHGASITQGKQPESTGIDTIPITRDAVAMT